MECRLLQLHLHHRPTLFPISLSPNSSRKRHCQLHPFHLSNSFSPLHVPHNPSPSPLLSSPSHHSSSTSDLSPIPQSHRTFSAFDIASLWIGLVVGIPSYYLAGSLVDLGMSWWQGIATVSLSNFLLLVPLTLSAFPGTRHGLSFPILARSTFGPLGSFIPSLLRSLVACGWFSIESWIGGRALLLLLLLLPFPHPPLPLQFASFLFFCLAQIARHGRNSQTRNLLRSNSHSPHLLPPLLVRFLLRRLRSNALPHLPTLPIRVLARLLPRPQCKH